MRLGLGTVQFGLDYGVSNTGGRTPENEVGAILEQAWASGIRDLDTAHLYGDSEQVLGRFVAELADVRIVTKTPHFYDCKGGEDARQLLRAGFEQSCARLGVEAVHGLMFHNPDDLLGPFGDDLAAEMEALKAEGRIDGYGVSISTPDQVDAVLDRFAIDMIQVPLNVFDQRLIVGGQIAALKARGVEVFARSLFLQGLLLMAEADVPAYFSPIADHLRDYRITLSEANTSPLAAALAFARSVDGVDVGLVGVNTRAQLSGILEAWDQDVTMDFQRFALDDPRVIDPSRWQL